MARVNVEQKALTDPRFGYLGVMLAREELGDACANDIQTETARCLGIGRMVMLWNACVEGGTYTLKDEQVFILLGTHRAAEFLLESGLAERKKAGTLRIKGTKGIVEWLENKRRANRENGKKGGRPKGTQQKPTDNPLGLPKETTLVPALTPVLTLEENPSQDRSGGGGGTDDRRNRDGSPLWSEAAFQYRADRIPEFVEGLRAKNLAPGDGDFDTAFEAKWGMGWERWQELRERHEKLFSRAVTA